MKDQIKQDIIKMLSERGDGVTFANLSDIPGFSGSTGMENGDLNIFIWFSCSEAGIFAVKELLNERKIELHPTKPLTYAVDGMVPIYPVATSDRRYKTPLWAPMALKRGKLF